MPKSKNTDLTKSCLRVGATAGGCSGYSYTLFFDDKFDKENDIKKESKGIPIVIDKKSLLFMDGTVIDYHDGLNKRGFAFKNPNIKSECGCGKSFQV